MHCYYMQQHGRTFNAEQKKPDTKSKHSICHYTLGSVWVMATSYSL